MMKSIASIAALASLSMAKKGKFRMPKLVVDYDYDQDADSTDTIDFLGLLMDYPATINFPKDKRARNNEECSGWSLVQATDSFTSFDIEELYPGKWCHKLQFTAKEDAEDYP